MKNQDKTFESSSLYHKPPESTATLTKSKPIKCIGSDSAYSSFVSNKTTYIMNLSNQNLNTSKQDSTGTSWSSRDEELEELFINVDSHPILEITPNRRSLRSSPWTTRPDSAPLHEEDEDDSDKEPQFSSFQSDNKRTDTMPDFLQLSIDKRPNRLSIEEADIRKEMIAIKLRAIAEKVPLSGGFSERTRRHSSSAMDSYHQQTHYSPPTNSCSFRRHNSFTSITVTDMLPHSCANALQLFMSLIRIYQTSNTNNNNFSVIQKSRSSVNFNKVPRRTHLRTRANTE